MRAQVFADLLFVAALLGDLEAVSDGDLARPPVRGVPDDLATDVVVEVAVGGRSRQEVDVVGYRDLADPELGCLRCVQLEQHVGVGRERRVHMRVDREVAGLGDGPPLARFVRVCHSPMLPDYAWPRRLGRWGKAGLVERSGRIDRYGACCRRYSSLGLRLRELKGLLPTGSGASHAS